MSYRTDGSDGGPAFPTRSGGGDYGIRPTDGMTLRDWFSGQFAAQFIRRAVSMEDWGNIPGTAYELDHVREARRRLQRLIAA